MKTEVKTNLKHIKKEQNNQRNSTQPSKIIRVKKKEG